MPPRVLGFQKSIPPLRPIAETREFYRVLPAEGRV